MFRRIALPSRMLPVASGVFLKTTQQRYFLTAPTPVRLTQAGDAEGDEFDVFEDDDMWFMEELLSEGGEMDFVIPSDDARILQGEKQ